MGRNWVPKYKVRCGCGWRGVRAATCKPCPKCGFCYPVRVKEEQAQQEPKTDV